MIYQYHCDVCDLTEDIMHGMTETPQFFCSRCNTLMRKLITGGSGIHYKGNGWPRKGSGLLSNPTKTTEVGVGVNSAMVDAVNPALKKSKKN